MTDRIPLEVCRRIIEHLRPIQDNATFAALSQTSRALQPIAEQILYRTLYLVGSHAVPTILTSFTSRPALLLYARQIYLHPNEHRTSHRYWTQVVLILSRVSSHLELLCISTQDPEAGYAMWVLQGLRDADCLSVLRVPFWWSTEMVEFLESDGARCLTRLEMGDTHPMLVGVGEQQQNHLPVSLALNPGAAPYLGIVEAPPNALYLLVPGRPVTHVKVIFPPAAAMQTLPPPEFLVGECLVRSTAPSGVIALDIGDLTHSHHGETYSLEVMELAPRFLPHLRFLGRVNSPWMKDVQPLRLYKPLIQLVELHTLELVVTHMHPPVDVYWELGTASELRTYSTSLQQIVFCNGPEMHWWVWSEDEGDFVLGSDNDRYNPWGGL